MLTCVIASVGYENLNVGRNEYEYHADALKTDLMKTIAQLYLMGVTDFYVNCEYGIPLWTAEILCELPAFRKAKLHIAVPYEEHTSDWFEDWRERYYKAHEKAESVHIPRTFGIENECGELAEDSYKLSDDRDPYEVCDEYMVDTSDLVLVFGCEDDNLYIAKYAKLKGIQVHYSDVKVFAK